MIEYIDVEERKVALATMGGIEQTVGVLANPAKDIPITNEDMERTRDEKAPLFTSCASSWARMKWRPQIR